MIHYIIPSTASPAMKSSWFKVKSISYEMKINEKNIDTIFQENVFENEGCWQATGLDAWASRVKCPARFVSHLHDICIYMSCL